MFEWLADTIRDTLQFCEEHYDEIKEAAEEAAIVGGAIQAGSNIRDRVKYGPVVRERNR